jgi:two-component system response regulator NreC
MLKFAEETWPAASRSVVLIDDHAILRNGLRRILEEHQYIVAGEAANAGEARQVLSRLSPAFVILDIGLPGVRGIELAGEILEHRPATRVVFLTVHKDEEYVRQALSIGASGYILKDCIDTEILSALHCIAEGGKYITPLVSRSVIESYAHVSSQAPGWASFDSLTNREREVLTLICDGKSSREIADLLCISARTAEHHRQAGMKKLGIRSLAELIRVAIKKKLVEL